MKNIIIILASVFLFGACGWAWLTPATAEEVKIEPLPEIDPAPLPDRKGYSTLPGWSAGYRYNFDVDNQELSKVRLFIKRKSKAGHIIKFAWERQTGDFPNFFRDGTSEGLSLNKTGAFFIEHEIKF